MALLGTEEIADFSDRRQGASKVLIAVARSKAELCETISIGLRFGL
jgi:hypothetical protein